MAYRQDCNDDLKVGPFEQSRYIWGCLQKRWVDPLIEEPNDYVGHILKATEATFPLCMDMPHPRDITGSLDLLTHADPCGVVEFWDIHIGKLHLLVK